MPLTATSLRTACGILNVSTAESWTHKMNAHASKLSICKQFASRNVRAASSGSAAELRQQFKSKQRSAVEIAQQHIQLISDKEARLGSFLHVDVQGALRQVGSADHMQAVPDTQGIR
jgi:hypothetical protein